MNLIKRTIFAASLFALAGTASAEAVSLSKLAGVTGGAIGLTAVYRADLSTLSLGTIQSIGITDSSAGLGGATGQFSGFDLDAIKLSTTFCASAACAAAATGLSVFDFIGGTLLTPGTQRALADPQLFGTGPGGLSVNNGVATLGLFDGESTTAIPGAFGFLSLGDNGSLNFNLSAAVSTLGVYLYIGEVGDNGEVAASSVVVRENTVPEPGSIALVGLALLGLAAARRRRA